MQIEVLKPIVEQFQLGGEIVSLEQFGSGNINDTYLSVVDGNSPRRYIHQRINQEVFPNPGHVMENMTIVTRHIREKLGSQAPMGRKMTLELISTDAGEFFYIDINGDYWRTTVFIPDAVTYDTVQNPEQAYQVGKVLGEFQQLVADIPLQKLHDTLPGFHHTPEYYKQFLQTLKISHPHPEIEARKQGVTAATLIDEIQKRESLAPLLMQVFDSGRLCERVVHNDPKVNNILFDVHSHQGIGMIDLDTVKPGLLQFDYGDCLRTAANPAGEETQNLQQVQFDLSVFERITKGYLEEAKDILTEADTAYLVDSIKLITFEMVIRFFADYLRGDVYFKKISYPAQNLNRARVQLVLLKDIERKESQIKRMLERLLRET